MLPAGIRQRAAVKKDLPEECQEDAGRQAALGQSRVLVVFSTNPKSRSLVPGRRQGRTVRPQVVPLVLYGCAGVVRYHSK